ncbi:hypothetical protein K505DRAFT_367396 [Melanomma pulvis-pyrius CBS 109.77]|uniref:Uncharacterized protein n=1 Tax=Melanomma pulvis-pyrius CBS 109.77 TaxID=1314802 RepID=A0A6A6WTI9_9PLEO|nr:hypothetical protein K505DRAFT_367396 [Melanomma pulvis-pyrius CBS 109.77]
MEKEEPALPEAQPSTIGSGPVKRKGIDEPKDNMTPAPKKTKVRDRFETRSDQANEVYAYHIYCKESIALLKDLPGFDKNLDIWYRGFWKAPFGTAASKTFMRDVHAAEEKLKRETEKLSTNEQIAESKLTVNLISNVLLDIESTTPSQETNFKTMVRDLYSATKNSLVRHRDTISRYSENTKDSLTAAQALQESLETKGSKEERKL